MEVKFTIESAYKFAHLLGDLEVLADGFANSASDDDDTTLAAYWNDHKAHAMDCVRQINEAIRNAVQRATQPTKSDT